MRILAIFSGEYGKRHIDNIVKHGRDTWKIETWQAESIYPPMIDYPEDYLPENFPPADLILSFAEHKAVAELLPDIARMTQARGVIAAVDNEQWLPRGLARQLREWLDRIDVICVTPKPLCSLTERDFGNTRRITIEYTSPEISEFARYFGKPNLKIQVDPKTRTIIHAAVERDAVCGCARYTAESLIGVSVEEASEKAGLLHHHYPCMASMGIDTDFEDTLMHISGNVLKENVSEQISEYRNTRYIRPGTYSEG